MIWRESAWAGSNVALHVNNLFDREYVASCFNTYGCFWGAERRRRCNRNLPFLIFSFWGTDFRARFTSWLLCRNTRIIPIPLFALRNISLSCARAHALYPLSLTFPAGKVTGLIGHNGFGKSTLLKMLGRHYSHRRKEILLDAQPLESWSSKAFARKVAYLPQQLSSGRRDDRA